MPRTREPKIGLIAAVLGMPLDALGERAASDDRPYAVIADDWTAAVQRRLPGHRVVYYAQDVQRLIRALGLQELRRDCRSANPTPRNAQALVSVQEYQELVEGAKASGLSLSRYCRQRLGFPPLKGEPAIAPWSAQVPQDGPATPGPAAPPPMPAKRAQVPQPPAEEDGAPMPPMPVKRDLSSLEPPPGYVPRVTITDERPRNRQS